MIPLLYITLVLFVIVCVFLILLVLIQKGRGGGLASAFGGMGGNTAFGSKTGDVLTWATSIVFGIFLLLAVIMNLISNRMDKNHREELEALAGGAPAPIVEPAVPARESDTERPAPAQQQPPAPAPAPAAAPA